MRVNVYAEEMTQRVEIIEKNVNGEVFTGLRLYLELPVSTPNGGQVSGPFEHRPGDDDSAAITFWGKRDLRDVLCLMQGKLANHYDARKRQKQEEEKMKPGAQISKGDGL